MCMSTFTKQFTKPLKVQYIGEDRKQAIWELTESFQYHVGSYPSDFIIHIESGFKTDFATVPRTLWSVFSPTGKYIKAAVIHDYLTDNKGKIIYYKSEEDIQNKQCYYKEIPKKKVDEIFKEAMGVLGVSPIVKYIVWKTVSMFGNREGYIDN
jgi:hypothetical protein